MDNTKDLPETSFKSAEDTRRAFLLRSKRLRKEEKELDTIDEFFSEGYNDEW